MGREYIVLPARFKRFGKREVRSCISSRIRSTARNAEWPSFM